MAMHRMHVFCWRDCRSRAFQQLNGRKVGAEEAMAGEKGAVCSGRDVMVVGERSSSFEKRAKTFGGSWSTSRSSNFKYLSTITLLTNTTGALLIQAEG